MGRHARDPRERFWAGVKRGGLYECWPWQYSRWGTNQMYGTTTLYGKKTSAHRVAYILSYGDVPPGIEVCHTCDNALCCNPCHLWLGTHAQNMQDKTLKGRAPKGSEGGHHTLNDNQVLEIYERYKRGEMKKYIALDMGVSPNCIKQIVRGETWKHLYREYYPNGF